MTSISVRQRATYRFPPGWEKEFDALERQKVQKLVGRIQSLRKQITDLANELKALEWIVAEIGVPEPDLTAKVLDWIEIQNEPTKKEGTE